MSIVEGFTEEEKQIYLKYRRAYFKKYREAHPEKVKKWRKQAILNQYAKLMKDVANEQAEQNEVER